MNAWYDNDAFWSDTAGLIFNKERLEAAPAEVEQICTLLSLPPGAQVLDLCCGVGRHSIPFARLGHRVTGVDRNEQYLAQARAGADRDRLDIEWVRSDMRAFRREADFDAAVNLLTSFGYFEDAADEASVLANVHASLKPGGAFLLDIMRKEVLARIFRERDWQEQPDGTILLEERKLRDHWRWLDLRWIVLRPAAEPTRTGAPGPNAAAGVPLAALPPVLFERRGHAFSLRVYSADELSRLFENAGFRDTAAYGSLDGRPYDQSAERLVVTGRKLA